MDNKFRQLVMDALGAKQELLTFLKEHYLQAPVAYPGCDANWPYFREGQNEMIRTFINIVENGLHGRNDAE